MSDTAGNQLHVVLDHQHGDSQQRLDVLDPERHVLRLLHVEAGGGFVEQEQLRVGAQSARQFGHLAHAIGEVDDQGVAVFLQLEKIDHLLDSLTVFDLHRPHGREEEQLAEEARLLVGVARQQQVVKQRSMLEQLDVLERPGDA